MSIATTSRDPATPRNRVLAGLPADDRKRLLDRSVLVPLSVGQVIVQPYEAPPFVYFPEEGAGSVITVLNDGTHVEAATIGYEGVVGFVPGSGITPTTTLWQVAGRAHRLSSDVVSAEWRRGGPVRERLERSGEMQLVQAAQTVACNRLRQTAGLISYPRGVMTIVDRSRLEAASCECYALIVTETARLLGATAPNHQRVVA